MLRSSACWKRAAHRSPSACILRAQTKEYRVRTVIGRQIVPLCALTVYGVPSVAQSAVGIRKLIDLLTDFHYNLRNSSIVITSNIIPTIAYISEKSKSFRQISLQNYFVGNTQKAGTLCLQEAERSNENMLGGKLINCGRDAWASVPEIC